MYDNRSCGGILCSFFDLVTLDGDPDGLQGLDLLRVFFGRIFVIEGDVYGLEAAGLCVNGGTDCFSHGVEVFDGAEDHLRALGECPFIGLNVDRHLCFLRNVRVIQVAVKAAGADSDGVVKDSRRVAGSH